MAYSHSLLIDGRELDVPPSILFNILRNSIMSVAIMILAKERNLRRNIMENREPDDRITMTAKNEIEDITRAIDILSGRTD